MKLFRKPRNKLIKKDKLKLKIFTSKKSSPIL